MFFWLSKTRRRPVAASLCDVSAWIGSCERSTSHWLSSAISPSEKARWLLICATASPSASRRSLGAIGAVWMYPQRLRLHSKRRGRPHNSGAWALNPRRLRPVLVSPHERWIQIAQVHEKETGRHFISRLHAHKRHARTIALGTPP